MNKRLLIAISLVVLILALAGVIILWVNRPIVPATPKPVEIPLLGFPTSPPTTNPIPLNDSRGESSAIAPGSPDDSSRGEQSVPQTVLATPTSITSGPLTKLSPTPVAGAVLVPRISSTTDSSIIYLEEKTGNLFHVAPDGRNSQQLTGNSLPNVARSWWKISRGTLILLVQSLDKQGAPVTFRSVYNLRATTTEPTELTGTIVPNVLAGAVAISPGGDRFFSLADTDVGVTGTITEILTGKARTIFTSRLKYWTVDWPTPTIITLVPRAAAGTPGTLYFLNPNNSALTRILGGEPGLTTLVNPSGTKILYGRELGELILHSPRDGKTRPLTITTLPEKCVWASDNTTIYCAVPNTPAPRLIGGQAAQYPDDWWSGEVAFNDSFWKVNTETGGAKVIFTNNSTGGNSNLDAVNFILDETGERLIFTDRWTAILWSLDLR